MIHSQCAPSSLDATSRAIRATPYGPLALETEIV
jgi:hypothetical protein